MKKIEGSAVHPGYSLVPVLDGAAQAKIRKWTMAQRADIKPRLAAVLMKIADLRSNTAQFTLPGFFTEAEDEIAEICRVSVELPEGISFDDLHWADLPVLAQGVWDTNIVTEDGGGLAGKLISLVAPVLAQLNEAGAGAQANSPSPSPAPKPKTPNSPASPSSAGGGESTPNASATP